MSWTIIKAWLTDVGDCDSAAGRALVMERFKRYQRHIPLIYAVALTNLVGMYLVSGGVVDSLWNPIPLLLGFVLVRLVLWYRLKGSPIDCHGARAELRKSWWLALLISTIFGVWTLQHLSSHASSQTAIVLFASLAAIGCSYAMSSLPAAARLPLLLLALPLTLHQIFSAGIAEIGSGISLGVLTILVLQLIHVHDKSFQQLVWSRSRIAQERETAEVAQQAAEAARKEALRLADIDPLTGLLNRRAFVRDLNSIVAKDPDGTALILVDLNGFKSINDTFGHATGDALLRRVADVLARSAQQAELVARMGGDEFAILVRGCPTVNRAQKCGDEICKSLRNPVRIDEQEFHVGLSCGIAIVGDCDPSEALFRADAAMYRAKRQRSDRAVIYSRELDECSRRSVLIEEALRTRAVHADMSLAFQPICALASGELRAFEALARWKHPTLGMVSPAEFIPVAEHINVIGSLTEHLLSIACRQAARWPSEVKLSFNVSAVQLCARGSSERLLAIVKEAGVHPRQLRFELTETGFLADYQAARENLHMLRSAGAQIFLDDFGAGHASVSYLREMRFDGLKLDGSFLARVSESLSSQRLLSGVLDLSRSIDLLVVAEHIETHEQFALLQSLGCNEGQGYFIAPPLSPDEASRHSSSASHLMDHSFLGFPRSRVA